MRSAWMAAGVGALALIAAGGSGVGALSPLSVPPGAGAPGGPVGDAVPINPGVELRPGESGAYASVAASTPVSVGDGVRTDATGFAEVAYGDGSRTRLDVNTDVEMVSLTDDAGKTVTGAHMGLGRTWASRRLDRFDRRRVHGGDLASNGDERGVPGAVSDV